MSKVTQTNLEGEPAKGCGQGTTETVTVNEPAPTAPPPTTSTKKGFTFKLGEDVTILGGKGSGKTVMCHYIYAHAPKAIVFNLTSEMGFHLLSDCYVVDDPEGVRRAVASGKYTHIEVIPSEDTVVDHDRIRDIYDELCLIAYKWGNCVIMTDELAYITRGENTTPNMERVALMGRHAGVSLVVAGQRNQLIPKSIVSQSKHLIVYALSLYDAGAYNRWIGFDLQAMLRDAPQGSYKWLWIREYEYSVEPPVPLLIDEATGKARVKIQKPERVN